MKNYPEISFDPWIYVPNLEKPGFQKLVGMRTFKELRRELELFLKAIPSDIKKPYSIYDLLDYCSFYSGYNKTATGPIFEETDPIPEKLRLICHYASKGSNEGYYFHVVFVYPDETGLVNFNTCITLKTLYESVNVVHEICEAINHFTFNLQ